MSEGDVQSLVSTDWLAQHLGDDDLRVFDCTVAFEQTPEGVKAGSGRPGYDEGHIPGAGFLDLLADLSDKKDPRPVMLPPAGQFADVLGRAGVGPDSRVVLYDRSGGMWAARIWWMLRCFGFERAAILSGGLRKWTAEGRPVSQEPPTYPPARFEARPRDGLMADKDEVLAAIEDARVIILNALPAPVHAGTVAPYGRPGRIPGSANVPADSLVDEAGAFLTPEELREAFGACGVLDAERVITYCGGGVSACSAAFALTLLGHPDVVVYDASLAEWANDPGCPMETDEGCG